MAGAKLYNKRRKENRIRAHRLEKEKKRMYRSGELRPGLERGFNEKKRICVRSKPRKEEE